MSEKEKIGGRAYSNGVRLMNSNNSVKAYYDNNDNLCITVNKVKRNKYMKYIKKIPVIRGIVSLLFAIIMFLKEVVKKPGKYWFVFAIIVADIVYMFLPATSNSEFVTIYSYFYIIFPILLLLYFRDGVSEVLKFHGAEHKAVHYYENDYKGDIADYSRIHRRCGSNIVFYYFMITIIFSFLRINVNYWLQEIIYLGIAYEAIKYTPEKLLFIPSLFQRIVTREPEEKQIKAARKALEVLTAKK